MPQCAREELVRLGLCSEGDGERDDLDEDEGEGDGDGEGEGDGDGDGDGGDGEAAFDAARSGAAEPTEFAEPAHTAEAAAPAPKKLRSFGEASLAAALP
jgi:hypothetical protein